MFLRSSAARTARKQSDQQLTDFRTWCDMEAEAMLDTGEDTDLTSWAKDTNIDVSVLRAFPTAH